MTFDHDLARRVDGLRDALRDAKDFKAVIDRFYVELAEDPAFLDASTQARDEMLEQAVAIAMAATLTSAEPVALVINRALRYGMWHGVAYCDGVIAGFFAFDESAQICLCITQPDGANHMLRMTWRRALPGAAHGAPYGGVRGTA